MWQMNWNKNKVRIKRPKVCEWHVLIMFEVLHFPQYPQTIEPKFTKRCVSLVLYCIYLNASNCFTFESSQWHVLVVLFVKNKALLMYWSIDSSYLSYLNCVWVYRLGRNVNDLHPQINTVEHSDVNVTGYRNGHGVCVSYAIIANVLE